MYVKTVPFKKNVVDKFYELKQAMKKRSPRGYCEKQVDHMLKVSNRRICGGRQNRNIGFYVATVFPVAQKGTKYCFHVPMDVNYGGLTMLDGKIMKQTKKDVWRYGKLDTKLLDFCVELEAGNHILELYGAEGCCDGTTRWTFQVNGGKWQDFTKDNLDTMMKLPAVEGDTVIEYGEVSAQQLKREWHTVKIKGQFNRPVVVMGTPSFNGPHPLTIRVKGVTRKQFQWQMQEWSYLDFAHTKETISYIIVEEGVHNLQDGTVIQAGKTIVGASRKSVKFDKKFTKRPVVLTQITTQ
jgi:hypothetical protein